MTCTSCNAAITAAVDCFVAAPGAIARTAKKQVSAFSAVDLRTTAICGECAAIAAMIGEGNFVSLVAAAAEIDRLRAWEARKAGEAKAEATCRAASRGLGAALLAAGFTPTPRAAGGSRFHKRAA